ncbi:hypothetical protein GCM10010967_57090 [Dyadobacter beijingensis]|uniref:Activator of Hsp90 ATPase homologue 1/2-like C-terminal domain-containing protein n=1 Tax=Dyadobacter beijingensis TaxID=365489 RepID=A0ABQ2ILG3_9BACT|nr:SRPBCC domain-containing protein [Dyadobacter beijingensis]GGN13490.1 hypothetical protein GCM10010967_57090 [Dyadobacter beijingensis]
METTRKDIASKVVQASADEIYRAIIDPQALAHWLPPRNMRARINQFEPWEGGQYRITLSYDHPDLGAKFAKSSDASDIAQGSFLKLSPGKCVVQSVEFVSDNPDFAGVMTMTYALSRAGDGTQVTIIAEHVPPGISPDDHLAGMNSTLDNLAQYMERGKMSR